MQTTATDTSTPDKAPAVTARAARSKWENLRDALGALQDAQALADGASGELEPGDAA
jgi:hypothetical protein